MAGRRLLVLEPDSSDTRDARRRVGIILRDRKWRAAEPKSVFGPDGNITLAGRARAPITGSLKRMNGSQAGGSDLERMSELQLRELWITTTTTTTKAKCDSSFVVPR